MEGITLVFKNQIENAFLKLMNEKAGNVVHPKEFQITSLIFAQMLEELRYFTFAVSMDVMTPEDILGYGDAFERCYKGTPESLDVVLLTNAWEVGDISVRYYAIPIKHTKT